MPPFIVTLCIHSLAGGASTRPKTLQDIHLSGQEGFVPNMGSKLTSAAEDGSNILGILYLCRNPNPKPPQSESTTRNPIQLPLHEFKTQKFPLQAYPMNPSHAPIQPACLHTNPAPSDPQIVEKKARIHSTPHLISPRPLPQLTDEKNAAKLPVTRNPMSSPSTVTSHIVTPHSYSTSGLNRKGMPELVDCICNAYTAANPRPRPRRRKAMVNA